MLNTIRGYYDQGHIVLQEKAPVTAKTEVIITFLTKDYAEKKGQFRKPGALKGKVTLPDNFNDPLDDLKEYM